MRGDQLIRQWKIVLFLMSSKKGKTVKEIKHHLDNVCCVRTINRDLEVLQIAGFLIYDVNDDKYRQKKYSITKELNFK